MSAYTSTLASTGDYNLLHNSIYNNPIQTWGTTTTGTASYSYNNGTITISPLTNPGTYSYYPPQPETTFMQIVLFIIGEDAKSKEDESNLMIRFHDIIGDKILFSPCIQGNKIEPLETIMKYIKSKKKFDIKLTRNGYEITIKGITFKKLTNMLSKDSDKVIKVSFDYDNLVYDNTLLSLEEKRSIKVNELMKNIKKHDIQ